MNLKELASPIRIYWDISGEDARSQVEYRRVCEEITDCRILSLNLYDSAPALSRTCISVLEAFKDKPVAVSLTLPLAALTPEVLAVLRELPVRMLLADLSSVAELESLSRLNVSGRRPTAGLSFRVDENNYTELPEALSFCARNGFPGLVIPMQRLTNDEACFLISADERRELTNRLSAVERPAGLKIIIHDPFIWRVFFPELSFPDGGCQAANTMLYISPAADVYPCPSLPVKLGSLVEDTLKAIVFSERKKELRRLLCSAPEGCRACGDLGQCMGGCRGRTYAMKKTLDLPDPSCG